MSVDARIRYNKLKRERDLFKQEDAKELLMKLKEMIIHHTTEEDCKGYDVELVRKKRDIKLAIHTLRSGLIFIEIKKINLEDSNSVLLVSTGYTSTIEPVFSNFIEYLRKLGVFKKILFYDILIESLTVIE